MYLNEIKNIHANLMGIDNNPLFGALIATKHSKWQWKSSIKEMNHLKFVIGYSWLSTDQAAYAKWPAWTPQTWNSVCLTTRNNMTRIYSNGQLVATVNKDLSGYAWKKNILLLATKNDESQFYHSVFGSITDVNIWNRSLSQREVYGWSTFKLKLSTFKILDWKEAELILKGTQVEDYDLDSLKKEALNVSSSLAIYTPHSKNSFRKGKYNCEGIGGSVSIPGDNIPLTIWNQSAIDSNSYCNGKFFTGYSELYEEDRFVSPYSNTSRSGVKWAKGIHTCLSLG